MRPGFFLLLFFKKLRNLIFRIFARITLSYGQGPRSSALDLLLYDSMCWDCTSSTGECKAKTKENQQCFFAAGTNTVQQVFRIGKTISAAGGANNGKLILNKIILSREVGGDNYFCSCTMHAVIRPFDIATFGRL